jgi:hypothetical protein
MIATGKGKSPVYRATLFRDLPPAAETTATPPDARIQTQVIFRKTGDRKWMLEVRLPASKPAIR